MAGLVWLLLLCLGASSATAERRLALVIGNSAYANTPALKNAANGAKAFSEFLTGYGFEVTTALNADRAAMGASIDGFLKKVQPGDVALFFYAGHGMQFDGTNYLLGTDAKLASEFDPGNRVTGRGSSIVT